MSEAKKRVIEGYEERACIRIGGGEIILAEKSDAEQPYMVCDCTWNNPFDMDEFSDAVVCNDYLEAFREYIGRAENRLTALETERAERGVPLDVFTREHCVKGGMEENMNGKVVVIKPESLAPEYRHGSHQLMLCTGGNGSRPEARGRAVFCTNIYTGDAARWERMDIAGVLDTAHMPEWARGKLAALERGREKPSVLGQLKDAEKNKPQQQTGPQQPRKHDPSR